MNAFTESEIKRAFIRVENIHRFFFEDKVKPIVEKFFGRPVKDVHGSGINIEVHWNTYSVMYGKQEIGSFEHELKY